MKPRHNTGQQPQSQCMKTHLATLVPLREPGEQIIIHHYTDSVNALQMEVERRSTILGILFERMFF